MKRTAIIVLLALAVSAGLVAFLIRSERPQPISLEEKLENWKPEPILGNTAQFTRIEFKRPNDNLVFEFSSQEGWWYLIEPLRASVEPRFFDLLPSDLYQMKRERLIDLNPKKEDLERYGLLNPPYVIKATQANGRVTTITFGNINYKRDHFFARLDDSPTVFLVKQDIQIFFDASLIEFRSKTLLLNHPMNYTGFEVFLDDPSLQQTYPGIIALKLALQETKTGAPQWVITSPVHENAQFDKVRNYLAVLAGPMALDLIDIKPEDLPQYGLDKPRARIVFGLKQGGVEEVDFGATTSDGGVYARNTSNLQVVVLDGGMFKQLLYSSFRSPNPLMDQVRPLVSRLEVEYPNSPEKNLALDRIEPWLYAFQDMPEQLATKKHLSYFLQPILSGASFRFLDQDRDFNRAPIGLAPPRLRIKIFQDNIIILDLSFGAFVEKEDEAFTYVEDNLRGCLLAVNTDIVSEFPPDRSYLVATPEEIEKTRERTEKRSDQE